MPRSLRHRTGRFLREHAPEVAVFVLLAGLLGLLTGPMMVYSVPAGYVGVVWKRFGGTQLNYTAGEGLHLKPPWDKVYLYDIRMQLIDRDFDVLSADGLKVTVNIAYRFWVERDEAPLLHSRIGPDYAEVLLAAAIGARARDIFSRNTPEEIYSFRRAEVQDEILSYMQEGLRQSDVPQSETQTLFINLEDVFIREITLPPSVQEAIAQKNQMQQRSLEYDYRLLLESKESERKRIEARGIKEFQDIVSQGITESYLRWRGIDATQALAASPNSKTVIIGSGSDGLPLILGGVGEASPPKVPQMPTSPDAGDKPDQLLDLTNPLPPATRAPPR